MLFSQQPNSKFLWHPFARTRPAQIKLFAEESIAAGMPEGLRKEYIACVDEGNVAWEKGLEEAKTAV